MEIRDRYCGYIPATRDGSRNRNVLACAAKRFFCVFLLLFVLFFVFLCFVFCFSCFYSSSSSDIVIFFRFPDRAHICFVEVCVVIKSIEHIKDSVALKYILYTHFRGITVCEARRSLDFTSKHFSCVCVCVLP